MEKPAAGTALRKRQQIGQANRVMFLAIAGVSVVVGISLVLVIFLAQKILFNETVISEKNTTVSTLKDNLKVVDESQTDNLQANIRLLNTNQALNSVKLNDSSSAVQSVLDALPADANSTALASSLQEKLLAGVSGITVESINVDSGDGTTAPSDATVTSSTDAGVGQIGFTFSVSADTANYDSLQRVLEKIEKSIRPFNITNLSIESQGDRVIMTASGVSYYSPAKTVQLTQKVVKP